MMINNSINKVLAQCRGVFFDMDGVLYEYIKPVSIIHYFKQLEALELDFVLVLSEPTQFNIRSENIGRFLEAGIFGIPCIAPKQFPYVAVISEYRNGYLYEQNKMVEKVIEALKNRAVIATIKQTLAASINTEYGFTEANIHDILAAYNLD